MRKHLFANMAYWAYQSNDGCWIHKDMDALVFNQMFSKEARGDQTSNLVSDPQTALLTQQTDRSRYGTSTSTAGLQSLQASG